MGQLQAIVIADFEMANEAMRKNRPGLIDAIVSSGVFEIVSECEKKGIITTDVKNKLTSSTTNYTDEKRADMLIDNISSSLQPEGVERKQMLMDNFLCVLYKKGNVDARVVAERVASDCMWLLVVISFVMIFYFTDGVGYLPQYRKLSSPHQLIEQCQCSIIINFRTIDVSIFLILDPPQQEISSGWFYSYA